MLNQSSIATASKVDKCKKLEEDALHKVKLSNPIVLLKKDCVSKYDLKKYPAVL